VLWWKNYWNVSGDEEWRIKRDLLLGKTPKIAGAASPFGSSDLKCPSFPPVAKGFPMSGIS